jgi:hypothetical protein
VALGEEALVPLLLKLFELDQTQPSRRLHGLDIRLSRARSSAGQCLTLIHPSRAGESDCRRYVGRVRVQDAAGRTAHGRAQIVATGTRILGLVMAGDLDGRELSDEDGLAAVFVVSRAEIANLHVMPGGADGARSASFRGGSGDPFRLEVEGIVGRLTNRARHARASVDDFLLEMDFAAMVAPAGKWLLRF